MRYISTRGTIAPVSFQDAVMMGLANDGGLLLPEQMMRLFTADAEVVRFLASPKAGYVTGQVLSVSGGLTMNG